MSTTDTTRRLITAVDVETLDYASLGQEASMLGLAPGEWPDAFDTDMGNGRPFILIKVDRDGTRIYRQDFGGLVLRVWND
jgi:hypothetical protein